MGGCLGEEALVEEEVGLRGVAMGDLRGLQMVRLIAIAGAEFEDDAVRAGHELFDVADLERGEGHLWADDTPEVVEPFGAEGGRGGEEEEGVMEERVWEIAD